jgi:hypothetical protein
VTSICEGFERLVQEMSTNRSRRLVAWLVRDRQARMHGDGIRSVEIQRKTERTKKTRERRERRRPTLALRILQRFAFAPSFACHSTLASNFLHAIARYWNCLVGDLSPSVIYFLNRSYLPACLACPFVRNFVRPIRVCTRVRAHAAPRNFPTSRDRFAISRLGIYLASCACARATASSLPADLESSRKLI